MDENNDLLYCTVLYCTVLYCTALYWSVLYYRQFRPDCARVRAIDSSMTTYCTVHYGVSPCVSEWVNDKKNDPHMYVFSFLSCRLLNDSSWLTQGINERTTTTIHIIRRVCLCFLFFTCRSCLVQKVRREVWGRLSYLKNKLTDTELRFLCSRSRAIDWASTIWEQGRPTGVDTSARAILRRS
jgi:hypothetical protein